MWASDEVASIALAYADDRGVISARADANILLASALAPPS